MTPRQRVGSILFTGYLFVSVPFYALAVLATGILSGELAYRSAKAWVNSVMWMLERLCRLSYVVEGREHLPDGPCILLLKHSSAWETIAQVKLFPRQTWVLKQELLWVPFFGWALKQLKPIAIDRRGGRRAVEQVMEQGLERLAEGLWVMVFPEGTRMPPGQTRRYGLSGVLLASRAGLPIVPVAHNAGDFWPRRGWFKRAGTVCMRIGPPIATEGREPREVNETVQTWIEAEVAALRAPLPRH